MTHRREIWECTDSDSNPHSSVNKLHHAHVKYREEKLLEFVPHHVIFNTILDGVKQTNITQS